MVAKGNAGQSYVESELPFYRGNLAADLAGCETKRLSQQRNSKTSMAAVKAVRFTSTVLEQATFGASISETENDGHFL